MTTRLRMNYYRMQLLPRNGQPGIGLMRNGSWQYKVNLIFSRFVRDTSKCTSVLANIFNSHGTQSIELDLIVNYLEN